MTNVIDCILKNSPWSEYWIFIKERQASFFFFLFEKRANLIKSVQFITTLFLLVVLDFQEKIACVFPCLTVKLEGFLTLHTRTLLLKVTDILLCLFRKICKCGTVTYTSASNFMFKASSRNTRLISLTYFEPNVSFLYPENLWFSDVFRGYRNETLA